MKFRLEDMVQRKFNFAIIDEVDSILIDEARTPLIISGPTEDSSEMYRRINDLIPNLSEEHYERDEKQYLPKKLWFDHDWNEIGEKRFREAKFARLDRTKPSPTIVTGSRMYYHPTENRYLTPREAASLQSFTSNFEFKGSNTSQWTQIGNAVPVKLAFEIGLHFKKILDF